MSIYRKHELSKKHSYKTRIPEIEHSSFTPLIFFQPQVEWLIKPHFLQASCFSTFRQMGYKLCYCNGMGMVLLIFLPSEISNLVSMGGLGPLRATLVFR